VQQPPPQLAAAAAAVFGGLRSAHVALGTAQGQAAAGGATREAFAAAMLQRARLFTPGQAGTLEEWVLTSKALREEPPSSKVRVYTPEFVMPPAIQAVQSFYLGRRC